TLHRLDPTDGVPAPFAIQGEDAAALALAGELPDQDVEVVVDLAGLIASVDRGDAAVVHARERLVHRGADGGVQGLLRLLTMPLTEEAHFLGKGEGEALVASGAPAIVPRLGGIPQAPSKLVLVSNVGE